MDVVTALPCASTEGQVPSHTWARPQGELFRTGVCGAGLVALVQLSVQFDVTFDHLQLSIHKPCRGGGAGPKVTPCSVLETAVATCVSRLASLMNHLEKQHLSDLLKWFLCSALESDSAFS